MTVLTNKNIWHKIWLILRHPKKFEHNWIKNGPAVRFYFLTLFANLNFLNFFACAIVQCMISRICLNNNHHRLITDISVRINCICPCHSLDRGRKRRHNHIPGISDYSCAKVGSVCRIMTSNTKHQTIQTMGKKRNDVKLGWFHCTCQCKC